MDGGTKNNGHGDPCFDNEEEIRGSAIYDPNIKPLTKEDIGRIIKAKSKEPIKTGWDKYIHTEEVDG